MHTISKEYRWEMSHRLPYHSGPCRHIHGHSYKMRVELEGTLNENSMILDYYDLDLIVKPVLGKLDHSFICDKNDTMVIQFLQENDFKMVIMDDLSTAENLSTMIMNEIAIKLKDYSNIKNLSVKVFETEDTFAETQMKL